MLVSDSGAGVSTKRLCEVCAEATDMSGAGIMLMSGDTPHGSICTTGTVSSLIEELQYDLGEGPCVTAGAHAIFGFPLRVGAVRLGALNLFRDRAGALDDDQHANALVMADVAAETVLLLQAGAPAGEVAKELAVGADFKYVVHQASGMVAAQLGTSVTHALLQLRAHAFGNDLNLTDVATDVVARNLRFHPETNNPGLDTYS